MINAPIFPISNANFSTVALLTWAYLLDSYWVSEPFPRWSKCQIRTVSAISTPEIVHVAFGDVRNAALSSMARPSVGSLSVQIMERRRGKGVRQMFVKWISPPPLTHFHLLYSQLPHPARWIRCPIFHRCFTLLFCSHCQTRQYRNWLLSLLWCDLFHPLSPIFPKVFLISIHCQMAQCNKLDRLKPLPINCFNPTRKSLSPKL